MKHVSIVYIEQENVSWVNSSHVTENKWFWKTTKPFCTEKTKTSNIIIAENNQTIRENKKLGNSLLNILQTLRKAWNIDKQTNFKLLQMRPAVGWRKL